MARNRVHIDAAPEEVFGVLTDPNRYPEWVVGASGVRDYDESFPEVGSRFHHEVGTWPLNLKDHTEVIEHDPPRRIVLQAKARPLGTVTIEIDLEESAGGTELSMDEHPGDRLTSLLAGNPLAEASGAEAIAVAADVTDRAALTAAIDEAAGRLGGLDVLVTAAAGLSFGRFVETEPGDFEATVETILGGTVDTIRAALPHLERSRGAVVAIGSIAARMPLPGMAAYTASKHGLVGFLETVRIELEESGSSVTLSLVNPGAVDTPLWSNLESSTGLLPPSPPTPTLYSAEAVAEGVLSVVRRPRDELTVGGLARSQVAFYSHFGGLGRRALRALARLEHTAGDRPAGRGGLSEPKSQGEIGGGFGGRPSLATKALGAWDGMLRTIGRG